MLLLDTHTAIPIHSTWVASLTRSITCCSLLWALRNKLEAFTVITLDGKSYLRVISRAAGCPSIENLGIILITTFGNIDTLAWRFTRNVQNFIHIGRTTHWLNFWSFLVSEGKVMNDWLFGKLIKAADVKQRNLYFFRVSQWPFTRLCLITRVDRQK